MKVWWEQWAFVGIILSLPKLSKDEESLFLKKKKNLTTSSFLRPPNCLKGALQTETWYARMDVVRESTLTIAINRGTCVLVSRWVSGFK